MSRLICLLSLMSLVSCAGLLGSRTYLDKMQNNRETLWKPGEDFPVVSGDTGRVRQTQNELFERTPLNPKQAMIYQERASQLEELSQLESNQNEEEYEKYIAVQDDFDSVSQRIYYLKLPKEQRAQYLQIVNNGRIQRSPASVNPKTYTEQNYINNVRETVRSWEMERADIYLGMSKSEVMKRWGRPDEVYVAGEPKRENEKWSFNYRGQVSYVYFEQGLVQGWYQE